MVKKILILGDINKKLLIPVLLAVSQILYNIHNVKFPEKVSNQVVETYTMCIAKFLTLIIPKIYKVPLNEDNIEISKGKKCLHYFLLCLFYFVNAILILTSSVFNKKFDEAKEHIKNPNVTGDFFKTGLKMIFIAVISIFLLKYKYFIHNYIAIAAFFLFGLFSDMLLDVFTKILEMGTASIIIDLVVTITDSVNLCYQKYMLEKLYYPYWNVAIAPGILLFLMNTVTLTLILISGKDSEIRFFKAFYQYFSNTDIGIIIGKFLINVILNFFISTFSILTLFYFSPDFILISLQLSKFVNVFMDRNTKQYYFIICVVLQFFCLLIYLEIIELNFCNLNKNTRRNIQIRGKDELLRNNDNDTESDIKSNIELSEGYLLKNEGEKDEEASDKDRKLSEVSL